MGAALPWKRLPSRTTPTNSSTVGILSMNSEFWRHDALSAVPAKCFTMQGQQIPLSAVYDSAPRRGVAADAHRGPYHTRELGFPMCSNEL